VVESQFGKRLLLHTLHRRTDTISTSTTSIALTRATATYAKLGNKQKAQEYFEQTVQWMNKHKSQEEELHRFHAEAANVLGLYEGPGDGKR
jgi:hypothetical protein